MEIKLMECKLVKKKPFRQGEKNLRGNQIGVKSNFEGKLPMILCDKLKTIQNSNYSTTQYKDQLNLEPNVNTHKHYLNGCQHAHGYKKTCGRSTY